MGCYRTILVALDGSPDAEAALRHGVALARDQHARLILLTVVPPCPPQMVTPGGVTPSRTEHEAAFREILRDGVDLLPPDVGVESRIAALIDASRPIGVPPVLICWPVTA